MLGLLGGIAAAFGPAHGRMVVSEVMADPSALPDADGEFIELGNAGEAAFAADTLRVAVDGDSFAVARVRVEGGGFFLLCRDSAAMSDVGAACHRNLPGMGLANGRALTVEVLGERGGLFTIPAAKPGVSWENTFAEAGGFREFLRSGRVFLGSDSATPGFRNSRSLRPAARDLRIAEARLESGEGALELRVEDLGSSRLGGGLSIRADIDWDGWAETRVDSLAVPPGGGNLRVTLGPDHVGLIRAELHGDADPAENVVFVHRGGGRTLEITEVCPDPAGGPEWAELRNATGEGGGFPRGLALAAVEWEGHPLGQGAGRLEPGEYLVLAEDSAAFRRAIGPLKSRVLELPGWPSLRNTGDTCRLSIAGHPLDSLAYGGKAAVTAPCLARSLSRPGGLAEAVPVSAPSPGYPASLPPARLDWRLSGRVLAPGAVLEVEVEAPAGREYVLRVFDLEGNPLALIGKGGPGRMTHAWDGTGPHGRRLPPGPYIVGFAAAGETARKRTVVVAGQQ